MNTFKQYDEQVSRRGFLKTLFGGAAAAAVTNPAKAASAVAKAANAPWIKVTLEQDFTLYDYTDVSADVIGTLSKATGKYTPGLSKDGSIMIDYNDSALDMMEVYVKPGTSMYNQMRARIDGEEQPEAGDAFEFDKQVFDTIADFDGNGGMWLEDQLEDHASRALDGYNSQDEDWKDEIAMVDGLEPDQYSALAQQDAAGI